MPLVSTSEPSGANSPAREIEVAIERLDTWIDGFVSRHGSAHDGDTPSEGAKPRELVGADHAARILIDLASPAEETTEIPVGGAPVGPGLIVGGDRQLVAQVLADRRLAALRELPRRTLYDLADPNRAVLETAIKRGTSVRILLSQTVAH